jgi:acylphosphatase
MADQRDRRTIHFAGQVQGVGFRYTTTAIAQNHAVQGFVQNLPDGRVLLVAEGTTPELNAFLDEVRQRLGRYVRQELTDKSAPTGEFTQFETRPG